MENIHINPVSLRVQDGTVFGGADLCGSCRFGLRRKSAITGISETRCAAIYNTPVVRTQIAQCTAYLEKGKLNIQEMGDIAWVIETKGKHIGFLTPEELRRRQQQGFDQPGPPRVGF